MLEESASAIPSSLWSSMNSWFTPTVLFVFLNIMIGTIVFTSSLANNHQQNHQNDAQTQNNPQQQHQPAIVRSPSVLQRLKSINLYRSQSPQTPNEDNTDSETLIFDTENAPLITQSHDYFFHNTSPENLEIDPQTQPHYVFEEAIDDSPHEIQPDFHFEESIPSFDGFQGDGEEKGEEPTENHFSRTTSDTAPASGEIPAKLPAKMRKSASLKSPFGHFEEGEIVEARRPATVKEKGTAKVTDGDEEVDAKADDFINKFKEQLKLQRVDSIIRYKEMIGRASGRG